MGKCSTGIDITSKDIKMVCLTVKDKQFQLTTQADLPLSDTTSISKVMSNPACRRGVVRFSLHDSSIKIRKITVPTVPQEELEEVIRWALKDALKTPVESHTLRYYPLSGAPEKQQSYLAIAVERKRLQEQLIELQKRGISHPQWIEPSVQALANCINYNYEPNTTDRIAVIHLDDSLAYCMVVSYDNLIFYRTFSRVSGSNQATDLTQFFSLLMVEIQYSYENYLAQFKEQPITSVILSGEGANLPGLQQHVEETLQVPCQTLEAFKKIILTEQQRTELTEKQAQYGVAVGLAL
jgi:Tfp pilus assembly PilM family ATPase